MTQGVKWTRSNSAIWLDEESDKSPDVEITTSGDFGETLSNWMAVRIGDTEVSLFGRPTQLVDVLDALRFQVETTLESIGPKFADEVEFEVGDCVRVTAIVTPLQRVETTPFEGVVREFAGADLVVSTVDRPNDYFRVHPADAFRVPGEATS